MARKAKKLFTIGYEQTPPKAVLDAIHVFAAAIPLRRGCPGQARA